MRRHIVFATLASTTPAHALPSPVLPLAVTDTAISVEVKLDGHAYGTFTDVVSISSSRDTKAKTFTVVLRRPATFDVEYAAWNSLAMDNLADAKKGLTITILSGRDPKLKFNLTKAFPSKVEYTPKGDQIMETVTLTCESMRRAVV